MATLSKHRAVHRAASRTAGCRQRKEKPAAVSSIATTARDFITNVFLPLYSSANRTKVLSKRQINQYFKAYKWLCDAYQLKPLDVTGYPAPYNILLTQWDANRQLQIKLPDVALHMQQDEAGTILLCVKQVYSTNMTWFYIPVAPVHRLLQQEATRSLGELLLSVFYYLYHTAKVPYYREHGTHLYWTYEMLEEWHHDSLDELEESEFEGQHDDINQAFVIGDEMSFEMSKTIHGELFKDRIRDFIPATNQEQDFRSVAASFFSLQQMYPSVTIFDHILPPSEEPNEEEDLLHFYKYISFTADCKGWLNDQLEDTLNCEFQEYGNVQEPTIEHLVDRAGKGVPGQLGFEQAFFPLLRNFCILLNELP